MSQLSKKNEKFSNKKEKKTLNFDVQLSDLKELNPNLSLAKCKIFYIGENRNGSFITQECADDMVKQLPYTAVVGEWKSNIDNFGGHGGKIEISSNGIEYIDTTTAYGCAMDTPTWYEDITEDDGTTHSYLCCNLVLFTGKYPELQVVVEKGSFQSMEIEVVEDEEKDGVDYIKKAIFSGLCILGKDDENPQNTTEPCFENSTIEVQKEQTYSLLKDELKTHFSLVFKEINEQLLFIKQEDIGTGDKIEIDLSKDSADFNTSWGSINKTSLKNKILKASNYKTLAKACYLVLEDEWENTPSDKLKFPTCLIKDNKLVLSAKGCESALSFLEKNTNESYYSSAKVKLKKYYKKLGLDTSNFKKEENLKMNKKEIAENFSLTYEQLEDEIRRVLSTVKYVCDDYWYGEAYECRKYWLQDFDEAFVYVYDSEQDFYVKLPYDKQGDDVVISFDKVSRVRTQFVDWQSTDSNNTDENEDINGIKEMEMALKQSYKEKTDAIIETKINETIATKETEFKTDYEAKLSEKDTNINDLTEKFNKVNEDLILVNTELDTLKAYKLKKETEEKEVKFAEYTEELSEEEIKPIKEKIAEFSLEEIDTKLKLAFANKNHKPNKTLPKYNNMGIENFNWNDNKDSKSETDGDVWTRLENKNN